jgi:hypothetical protein
MDLEINSDKEFARFFMDYCGINSDNELAVLFEEFLSLPFPRLPKNLTEEELDLDDDIIPDIAEEDSYLAGLVTSFLQRGNIDKVPTIVINSSIDYRLSTATAKSEIACKFLEEFREYRALMLKTANLLSEKSGKPIVNSS